VRVFRNDGNLFVVMTTGDIKDIRDTHDILTINYFTDIKDTWIMKLKKILRLGSPVRPIRAITITNEKSYANWVSKNTRGEQ
jgi:hypothetical protein